MKNLKITLFLPLLLGMSFVVINPCLAQATTNNADNIQWGGAEAQSLTRNLADEDPRAALANILRLLLSALAIIAFATFIYGSIRMIINKNNDTKRASSKKMLVISLVVLFIVLLAFASTYLIFQSYFSGHGANSDTKIKNVTTKNFPLIDQLPRIDCATFSEKNDSLTDPVILKNYYAFLQPRCIVFVNINKREYQIYEYRDKLRESPHFKQVSGSSMANIGFNVLEEDNKLTAKLWKLKADCSKWDAENNLCSFDELLYEQPLKWHANDEEWSKIGEQIDQILLDNFIEY